MQNLFMMAVLVRENQMKNMAKEIVSGLISIEQAMIDYNVASKKNVLARVERLNEELEYQALMKQAEVVDYKVIAA